MTNRVAIVYAEDSELQRVKRAAKKDGDSNLSTFFRRAALARCRQVEEQLFLDRKRAEGGLPPSAERKLANLQRQRQAEKAMPKSLDGEALVDSDELPNRKVGRPKKIEGDSQWEKECWDDIMAPIPPGELDNVDDDDEEDTGK